MEGKEVKAAPPVLSAFQKKIKKVISSLEGQLGVVKPIEFAPPPSSAETDAALKVAAKNSEIIAGAILGLSSVPKEGMEWAKKLMDHYVDWNEVRVANSYLAAKVLGNSGRTHGQIKLLQRFLEAFFLRQRNINLEFLISLKPPERKQFLTNLQVFEREELASFLLTCFNHPVFPPCSQVHEQALKWKLIKPKMTVLQMAKEFEKGVAAEDRFPIYVLLKMAALKEERETARSSISAN